ncbi:MAG: NAD(P)H-dependent glycerol-3-phosphate dehydrogenase [Christensenellales bacterium]|jgi:glycerol-3-phosphate dehydrogenase (NAD(P)+)
MTQEAMGSAVGILGTGTWGTALARMLAINGHQVTAWSPISAEIETLAKTRKHPKLPGVEIPASIRFTEKIEEACRDKHVVLFAVPSIFVRETAAKARPFIKDGQIIADASKGIEANTLYSLTMVIQDELSHGNEPKTVRLVALSGPTHAEEVARDMPTTIVAASDDLKAAETVQDIFMNTCMRVYTNEDIRGVELCGALKNIIALACGISGGLGYGDNTRAALITRGMAEITRLGIAMGCQPRTFSSLAGIGDLIVTATSAHSRNNRAGTLMGQGASVKEAVEKVGMVVEGLNALPAAMRLAEKHQADMPIIRAVDAIVAGRVSPDDAVDALMQREKKHEFGDQ